MIIKTNCKNCGVEFSFKELKNKKDREYCSKKCSSSCPSMIEKRNQKQKETFLLKYENGHPMRTKEVKEKHQTTMLEHHGVTHALKSKILVNKSKETKLEKYNDENYCNVKKIKETKLNKYGSLYTPGEGGVKLKAINRLNDLFFNSKNYTPLFNKIKIEDDITKHFHFKCNSCDKIFKFKNSNSRKPICKCSYKNYYTKHSKAELEIGEFLTENNIEFKKQDRKILSGYELDIYIPNYNLAIEVNGIYWHSEKQGKTKYYHINKTLECKSKGIHLIHITDIEWYNKKDIIKSIILSKLNKNKERLFAKQLIIKEIKDNKLKDNFLNENHLQSKDISKIKLGLFYNNELYSVMTFGKPRFNKNYEYELIRFCNKKYTTIVGGFAKLLKYFIKNYSPNNILTYSNADFNTGDIYLNNNFKYLELTPPNYFYFKNNDILSRYETQTFKLKKLLNNYDNNLNEYDNLINNGYNRYWNCGNYKFELIIKK
jgi:hypothetical protein